jgi:hypothetical protein
MARLGRLSGIWGIAAALGLGHETASSRSEDSAKHKEPASIAVSPNDPKVTLIAPGKEPRTLLRLGPAVDSTQNIVLLTRASNEMAIDGKKLPTMTLPRVKLPVQFKTTSVGPDGLVAFELEFGKGILVDTSGSSPEVLNSLQDELDRIYGIKGHGEMTSRGFLRNVKLAAARGC